MTALALAGACEPPPPPIDPPALAARAGLHTQDIVHTAGGSISFSQEENSGAEKVLKALTNLQNDVSSTGASPMPSMPVPPAMMRPLADNPMIRALAGDTGAASSSLRTTEEQFDDTAADLRSWLQDRIFADTNLETRTDDSATYLLRADPTCRPLTRPEDPPGTVRPISTSCQRDLEKLQVRVVMRAGGDGIQMELLLGPDRLQLSVFTIHSDLLAWESDLPRTKAAIDYANRVLDEGSPVAMSPLTALTGRVRLALHKDGVRKVTLSFGLPADLHVAANDELGHPQFDLRSAKSDPLLAVSADGVAKKLTVATAVGNTNVRFPWQPKGSEPANLDAHVAIGGLFGTATIQGGVDELRWTGIGIGPTTFDVRGARVFDLNLNPQNNHRFDLVGKVNADGVARFEVSPRFDLAVGVKLAAIANDFTSPPPAHFLDETYGVLLANPAGASVFEVVKNNNAGWKGGIKITAGTLTLSSSRVSSPVVVPTGKCLTGKTAADGAHPILGAFEVVDCP